ncbi:FkbM family methyltransferase [Mesorhizobium sp.]|uniref:FkbM family methyltransferase n=1 Tax=Mesorhizobium sp. TaxID=1871066 RepID=UPI000FE81138|nr:FkbM family methyltransferase [Mesorhizobium sp.]RWN35794.1 MAG: FkbM family methyltransferase [Mesorhizobium sp.]
MKQIRGMWFPDSDEHLEGQLAINPLVDGRGTYQYRKYARALTHVKTRGHAVDIGAQVGLWSRVMALDFTRVTAFEPLPAHLECYERNLAEPLAAGRVDLHRVALDSVEGELAIAMPPESTGNSHVAQGGEQGELVAAHMLDGFGLAGIDFLKIDVEGYEKPILEGGEQTIRRERPVIIIEQKPNGNAERYGRGRLDALELLKSWGAKVMWEIGGDFLMEWQ